MKKTYNSREVKEYFDLNPTNNAFILRIINTSDKYHYGMMSFKQLRLISEFINRDILAKFFLRVGRRNFEEISTYVEDLLSGYYISRFKLDVILRFLETHDIEENPLYQDSF